MPLQQPPPHIGMAANKNPKNERWRRHEERGTLFTADGVQMNASNVEMSLGGSQKI